MLENLLNNEKQTGLRDVVEHGDTASLKRLVRIDFPQIPIRQLLMKRLEERPWGNDVCQQIGYEELKTSVPWKLFSVSKCSACEKSGRRGFSSFQCGDKVCQECSSRFATDLHNLLADVRRTQSLPNLWVEVQPIVAVLEMRARRPARGTVAEHQNATSTGGVG